ncbi:MAG: VanZ family protein [Bacteroidaceae bacterium]|nr:VanZ family protein [Bacteroidaceae bacterium]
MLTFCKEHPLSWLVTVAIVLLSLLPIGAVEIAENVPFADKWTHMVMYAVLTLVIWMEHVRRTTPPSPRFLILWAILFPITLGGILELLQAYATTYRSGEWMDWAADSVGTLLAIPVAFLLTKVLQTKASTTTD